MDLGSRNGTRVNGSRVATADLEDGDRIEGGKTVIRVAIRHGNGSETGLHVVRLCEEELFPVCSPKLLKGKRALRTPTDLRHAVLLHVNDRQDWKKWLEAFRRSRLSLIISWTAQKI